MRNIQWQICIFMCILMAKYTNGSIGINWGTNVSYGHLPSIIADLCLRNEIKEVKLSSCEGKLIQPFTNTGINMSITIRDEHFDIISNITHPQGWIHSLIGNTAQLNVDFRYIMISDDPFMPAEGKPNDTSINMLQMVSDLVVRGDSENQAKVSIPHSTDVLKPVLKPSDGEFKDEIKDLMKRTVDILKKYNAPFVLNIMPFDLLEQMKMPINFALFSNNKLDNSIIVKDVNSTYTNMFDFWYDTCIYALRKMGAGDLEIVVGKIGWPTDGAPEATPENAAMFYRGLMKKAKEGTPLNPKPIHMFLETLIDENFFKGKFPVSRHMGIFEMDGKPKFPIDFTGQGRNITPISADGITYLPTRYCIYPNSTLTDIQKVFAEKWINAACNFGDCSPIQAGSCSNISEVGKLSYALNLLYQMTYQSKCTYDHLGTVVYREKDPSSGNCVFPVALIGFAREKQ